MHLNKTKFKRNPSLGFDVCNITKAGNYMYIVRADIKSRGIDSLCRKGNGTQSFSGCSPGKFKE